MSARAKARAAAKALYARQYSKGLIKLTVELEAALEALLDIVKQARPRKICMRQSGKASPLIYADAFVKVGEREWKLADAKDFDELYGDETPATGRD